MPTLRESGSVHYFLDPLYHYSVSHYEPVPRLVRTVGMAKTYTPELDYAGRPTPIVTDGRAIADLLAVS